MRKAKSFLILAVIVLITAGLCIPQNLFRAEAGSSKSYIVSAVSIGDKSINTGDFSVDGKVTADNGKAVFDGSVSEQSLTTSTKARNLKDYGVKTLFDFKSTFTFLSFGEEGRVSLLFGLDKISGTRGDKNSFSIEITYSSSDKRFTIGAYEYLADGSVKEIYSPQSTSILKLNRTVLFKVNVDTDGKLNATVTPQGNSAFSVASDYPLTVDPQGYISYYSQGGNNFTLSDPEIVIYKYDAPENVDYVETFDKEGKDQYNANVFYSACDASAVTPASLSVKEGKLVFENTAAAYISTGYKYSNFELCFDIVDLARKAVKDENGNYLSYISAWFGIAFGVDSVDQSPDTTTRYTSWVQLGDILDADPNYKESKTTRYVVWDNSGSWNAVKTQVMTDFNPWDDRYDNETINVRFTMTDGVIRLYYKIDGDAEWGEPYLTYDYGRVKTGYVRIFTADGDNESVKGLAYTAISNFSIDNLSIKNTDDERSKNVLPTPAFKSNLTQKTPDFDYKTNPSADDLIANKIQNGDMNGGSTEKSGCSSSVAIAMPFVAFAVIPFVKRKRK